MKIYEVSTDCLVDFCMLRWYIRARNMKEAWYKGWQLVRKCTVADEGAMDVKRFYPDHTVKMTEVN